MWASHCDVLSSGPAQGVEDGDGVEVVSPVGEFAVRDGQ